MCVVYNITKKTFGKIMAHPSMGTPTNCMFTPRLQSTHFNVLYAFFSIGPNVLSHYASDGV